MDNVYTRWVVIYRRYRQWNGGCWFIADITLIHDDGWKQHYSLTADSMRVLYRDANSLMRRIQWKNPRVFTHCAFEVIS